MDIFDFRVIDANMSRDDRMALFAKFLDATLDAIVLTDAEGTVFGWSSATALMFGWAPQEAIGKKLHDLIIPQELIEKHCAGMDRLRKTRKHKLIGRAVEVEGVNKAGTRFPIELAIAEIEHDNMFYYAARLRDISDRKSYEMNLLRLAGERAAKATQPATLEQLLSREAKDEALRAVVTSLHRVHEAVDDYKKGGKYTPEQLLARVQKVMGVRDDPYSQLSVDFFRKKT